MVMIILVLVWVDNKDINVDMDKEIVGIIKMIKWNKIIEKIIIKDIMVNVVKVI